MRRGLFTGLVVLALCLVVPAVAAAQTWTWTNSSGDGTWSNGLNWDQLSAPSSPADLDFPATPLGCVTNCYTSTNDLSSELSVGNLTIDANSPYAITGNQIALTGGLGTTTSSGNGSPALDLPIDVSGSQTWTVSGGTLTVAGALTDTGTVTLNGSGQLTLANPSGLTDEIGGLTTAGTTTLALGQANTSTSFDDTSGGPLSIGGGTTLALAGTVATGPLEIASGATLTVTAPSSCGSLSPGSRFTVLTATSLTGQFANQYASIGCPNLDAAISYSGGSVLATVVNQTTTSLSAPSSVSAGDQITVTATVTPATGAPTPTGTVEFEDNGSPIASCPGTLTNGTATCPLTYTTTGTHAITASYSGDSDSEASQTTSADTITVNPVAPAVGLTIDPLPGQTNEPLALSATVSGTDGTPTGTVAFVSNTGAPECPPVSLDGSGHAACSVAFTAAGAPASITAEYTPTSPTGYSPQSSAPEPLTVNESTPAAALAISDTGPQKSQPVSYTVTLAPAWAGASPSGTVSFEDNGTVVGGCGSVYVTANGSIGTATCQSDAGIPGAHTITAHYSGDSNFTPTDANPASMTVYPSGSSTSLSLNPANPVTDQPVTVTATVAPSTNGNVASGSVSFADSGQPISGCTGVVLDSTSHTATCQTSFAASASPVALSAAFSPDQASQAAASNTTADITIARAGTALALASSRQSPTVNQAVTYTATVAPAYAGATQPLGTVSFSDNGAAISGCTNQPLGAQASASCTVGYPSTSTHAVTASYSGDADFAGSSAGPLTVTVVPPALPTVSARTLAPARLTTTSALLKGIVDTGGAAVTWQFQYGPRLPYTKATPVQSVGGGHGTVSVSAPVKLLRPATRYHVQLVVLTVGDGQSTAAFSRDLVFTTRSLGKLTLAFGNLRTATNAVALPLRCARAAACRGWLTLTATTAPAAHGHPARTLRCARVPYRIAAGGAQSITATLSRGCLARARAHHGRLRITAAVTPQTPQLAFARRVTLVLRG
jgi:hypothetical protein